MTLTSNDQLNVRVLGCVCINVRAICVRVSNENKNNGRLTNLFDLLQMFHFPPRGWSHQFLQMKKKIDLYLYFKGIMCEWLKRNIQYVASCFPCVSSSWCLILATTSVCCIVWNHCHSSLSNSQLVLLLSKTIYTNLHQCRPCALRK